MGFEPIKNSFADYCLNHSATLSFAEGVGIEPTRVINSEQFSRLWPPPIGLPFHFNINMSKFETQKKHLGLEMLLYIDV